MQQQGSALILNIHILEINLCVQQVQQAFKRDFWSGFGITDTKRVAGEKPRREDLC